MKVFDLVHGGITYRDLMEAYYVACFGKESPRLMEMGPLVHRAFRAKVYDLGDTEALRFEDCIVRENPEIPEGEIHYITPGHPERTVKLINVLVP